MNSYYADENFIANAIKYMRISIAHIHTYIHNIHTYTHTHTQCYHIVTTMLQSCDNLGDRLSKVMYAYHILYVCMYVHESNSHYHCRLSCIQKVLPGFCGKDLVIPLDEDPVCQ